MLNNVWKISRWKSVKNVTSILNHCVKEETNRIECHLWQNYQWYEVLEFLVSTLGQGRDFWCPVFLLVKARCFFWIPEKACLGLKVLSQDGVFPLFASLMLLYKPHWVQFSVCRLSFKQNSEMEYQETVATNRRNWNKSCQLIIQEVGQVKIDSWFVNSKRLGPTNPD